MTQKPAGLAHVGRELCRHPRGQDCRPSSSQGQGPARGSRSSCSTRPAHGTQSRSSLSQVWVCGAALRRSCVCTAEPPPSGGAPGPAEAVQAYGHLQQRCVVCRQPLRVTVLTEWPRVLAGEVESSLTEPHGLHPAPGLRASNLSPCSIPHRIYHRQAQSLLCFLPWSSISAKGGIEYSRLM